MHADRPSSEQLRLDEQLCFALYAATNAITRRYRAPLAQIGLTYPQYLLMMTLWQDGPSSIGRLAHRLEIDSHAVSPIVDRLVAAGLVTRRRGDDRRTVLVEATTRGSDLEAAAAGVQADVACATALLPDELAALREELRRLTQQLAAAAPTHDGPDRSPAARASNHHEGATP